jgi:hypothetical protein
VNDWSAPVLVPDEFVATSRYSHTGPASAVGTTGTAPNTSYGSWTSSRSAGSATGAQPVSITVSNLTPGTTYHFRLIASNSAGTS